jgi:hypothetical protein
MAGRKADGAGVVTEVDQSQRRSVVDEDAENASPPREIADQSPLGIVDARRDEPGERCPGLVKHAKR